MDEKRSNIVVLVLDTARAENLSVHGYKPRTTPNLERIAENATVYERAISPSPWTLPSHASLLSGLYPSHHGTHRSNTQFEASVDFLPQILNQAGYDTTLISANKLLLQDPILRDSFDDSIHTVRRFPTDTHEDHYTIVREQYDGLNPKTVSAFADFVLNDETSLVDGANIIDRFWRNRIRDGKTLNSAKNSVNEFKQIFDAERDNFVLVNFMNTHLKYDWGKKFLQEVTSENVDIDVLRDVNQDPRLYNYANAISMSDKDFQHLTAQYNAAYRTVDHYIGKIYDYLLKTGEMDNTLFIVLSDHGENLGETGKIGHSLSLSDYVCHVPLIISYPGQNNSERIGSLVQTHDIFETILEAADIDLQQIELSTELDSVRLPRSATNHSRSFAISEYLGSPFEAIENVIDEYPNVDYSQYDFEMKSIYSVEGYKYTVKSTGEESLQDISDRSEIAMGERTDLVTSLRHSLYERVPEFGQTRTKRPTEEIEAALKDLGYI